MCIRDSVKTLQMAEDVLSVCVSPDGKLLSVSLLDNTLKVFFVDSLKFFLSLYGHRLPALCHDVSSDSRLLASGGADKNVRIWGLDFGDCHKSLFAHDDSVTSLKFVPKTHYLFSCGKDSTVKYWDADKFARDYVALRYARACAPGAAVVLGSGYSKSPYWLARTGAFRAVLGVDASASAVGAMRRFAASRAHGGGGWDRVRFLHRDVADLGLASGAASLVVDEGVLDVLQGVDGGRTAASRARMAAHLAEAARVVARGGELAVVGFAGPAGVVNATALGAAACWARAAADAESPARRDSPYFVHDLDRLYRQRRDPRRACSPFGPGAYLLRRPGYASRGRRGGRWCRARVALPPHVGVAGDGASTRWSSANAKSASAELPPPLSLAWPVNFLVGMVQQGAGLPPGARMVK